MGSRNARADAADASRDTMGETGRDDPVRQTYADQGSASPDPMRRSRDKQAILRILGAVLVWLVIRTPVRAPNANAFAERVIETMRAECLDRTLILGRRHLDRTLRTYAQHDNRGRPHRALALAPPLGQAGAPIPVNPRDVRRLDLLGGLIHEYHAAAA
jgi:transposase InsO family protein